MNDDERLQQTFRKLREADARRVPAFEAIRSRPATRRSRSVWLFLGPAAGGMASAAVMLLWCAGQQAAEPSVATTAPAAPTGSAVAPPPADTAPLDFLLDVPNRGLFAATPRLDTSFLAETARADAVGGGR